MNVTFEELMAMHHNLGQTTDAMIKMLEPLSEGKAPTEFIEQVQIIAQATKSQVSLLAQIFEKNGLKIPT